MKQSKMVLTPSSLHFIAAMLLLSPATPLRPPVGFFSLARLAPAFGAPSLRTVARPTSGFLTCAPTKRKHQEPRQLRTRVSPLSMVLNLPPPKAQKSLEGKVDGWNALHEQELFCHHGRGTIAGDNITLSVIPAAHVIDDVAQLLNLGGFAEDRAKLEELNENGSLHVQSADLDASNDKPEWEELITNRDAKKINIHSATCKNDVDIPRDMELEKAPSSPGVRRIIKFAIPAIGIWLCGPLLSMIDTAAVGLLAGTNHQAALSPAVAVTDYSALLLVFLYAATTNLVAAASASPSPKIATNGKGIESGTREASSSDTRNSLLSSLQLSLYVGLALGTSLYSLAPTLIKALIGTAASLDPAVFGPAVQYVRTRALGMPAAAVLGSAQAACLGLKDTRSPLVVMGTAAIVNLIGDTLFVGSPLSWLNGAVGAAWATVISQYVAVTFFLHWLKVKPSVSKVGRGNILNIVRRIYKKASKNVGRNKRYLKQSLGVASGRKASLSTQQTSGVTVNCKKVLRQIPHHASLRENRREEEEESRVLGHVAAEQSRDSSSSFSTRGYLASRSFQKRDIFQLPNKDQALKFLPFVIPVTTTSVGRVSLFLAMAHVVSSSMGTIGMAAQQIVMAFFEALCPVADSLSLTAQSFVPAALSSQSSKQGRENEDSLKVITKQFMKAGSIFGAVMVGLTACIPLISRFFSTDALVLTQVNAIAPYLAAVFAMHGVMIASEGVLLGQRDLKFLGWMYSIYFALMPTLMMQVKRSVHVVGKRASLQSVWNIFLGYQLSRTILWVGRALWLTRKKQRKSPSAVEVS